MLLLPKTDIIDKLIQLSKIFKDGYTVAIYDGNIEQINIKKGYVVSHKTIVTINLNNNTTKLHDCEPPLNNIIGGWLDKTTNIYYIELNKIYQYKKTALKDAKQYKQKYIYNLNSMRSIKVE